MKTGRCVANGAEVTDEEIEMVLSGRGAELMERLAKEKARRKVAMAQRKMATIH